MSRTLNRVYIFGVVCFWLLARAHVHRRYIPELKNVPEKYLYEPWKCPESVQKKVGCIIGKDYPQRIVDHGMVARENRKVNKIYSVYVPDHGVFWEARTLPEDRLIPPIFKIGE